MRTRITMEMNVETIYYMLRNFRYFVLSLYESPKFRSGGLWRHIVSRQPLPDTF